MQRDSVPIAFLSTLIYPVSMQENTSTSSILLPVSLLDFEMLRFVNTTLNTFLYAALIFIWYTRNAPRTTEVTALLHLYKIC